MIIKVKLDEGAYMPVKSHIMDAGFDIKSPKEAVMFSSDQIVIDTGIHMEIPKGFCGYLISKSGLNTKYGVTSTGLIDAGYTGSIRVKLYRNDDNNADIYRILPGEKISQLIILPVPEVDLFEVKDLAKTERGDGGFGSTGRF